MYFKIILCFTLFILLYKSFSYQIDFFTPNEFNEFESKRLQIYIGNLLQNPPDKDFLLNSNDTSEIITFSKNNKLYFKNNQLLTTNGNYETILDLERIEQMIQGDGYIKISTYSDSIEWFRIPTLVKTRYMYSKTVSNPYAILMRFRTTTHFQPIFEIKNYTVNDFDHKIPAVIWRGGPSGSGFGNIIDYYKPSRENLLKRWSDINHENEINIGLVPKWNYIGYEKYIKNEMHYEDFLKYKYILSVEGNDVATNLKWALSSNSVVIMHKPYVESWFSESLLEPWVHYVPVKDDFSDLYTIKKWCDENPEKCKEIIHNANTFVSNFTNENRERYLASYVINKYLEKVRFKII